MKPYLQPLAALLLAAFLAIPAAAQEDREPPRDEEEGEVVIERDGNVFRFRVPHPGGDVLRWKEGEHPRFFRADTVIDGRHVIRFRTPDGEGEVFEFEVPEFDFEDFRMREMPEFEHFRVPAPPIEPFEFEHFAPGDAPFGFHMREWADDLHGLEALSDETRREMMRLERRAHELAADARRADGDERDALERELEEVLEQLYEVRGQMREEQAARLEQRAERLREEAEELRQALRERDQERRALIEERKRELLGEPGADW
jgi:hypothetical protein